MNSPSIATRNIPIHILLIEDNCGDVRLAQEAFSGAEGLSLHVVPDGVEGMAFLLQERQYSDALRPDLILLDLDLPNMDGREVLSRVKKNSALRAIPTIVLTSSDRPADVAQCYALNANCFIRKPDKWDEFQHLVDLINALWLPGLSRCVSQHRSKAMLALA